MLAGGVASFAAAYTLFAVTSPAIALLAVPFVLAGIGIGAVETAQHAAVATLAPTGLRGSAFGLLATVQSLGNLAASGIAGLLWTLASPATAFFYLTAWMILALIGLLFTARPIVMPDPCLTCLTLIQRHYLRKERLARDKHRAQRPAHAPRLLGRRPEPVHPRLLPDDPSVPSSSGTYGDEVPRVA